MMMMMMMYAVQDLRNDLNCILMNSQLSSCCGLLLLKPYYIFLLISHYVYAKFTHIHLTLFSYWNILMLSLQVCT